MNAQARLSPQTEQTMLAVPGMHCAGCMSKVERGLCELPGVESARVNLTARIVTIDTSVLEPQIAFPHSPDNVRALSDVGDVPLDQVFIGSCTNGRIEDLRIAAQVLKGEKISDGVRAIVSPATTDITA